MSIEQAREYLKKFGIDNKILEFSVSSATVELAAQALNCKGQRIAKTMSFKIGEDRFLVIVTAGDTKIDNSKYKGYFHAKAKMLTAEEAVEHIGHAPGGVCPFGVKDGVEIYLDESLKRFSTVFPAAGSSNSAIELTPDELDKYSQAKAWVDVCKIVEPEQ